MALCASFAMLYATFVRVTVPDVGTYWLAWIQSLSDAIREQGGKIFEPEEIIHEDFVEKIFNSGIRSKPDYSKFEGFGHRNLSLIHI